MPSFDRLVKNNEVCVTLFPAPLRRALRFVLLVSGVLCVSASPQLLLAQGAELSTWTVWVRYDLDGKGTKNILAQIDFDTKNHSDSVVYGGAAGWCGKAAHKTKYPTPAGTEVHHVHFNYALTDAHIQGEWYLAGYPNQPVTVTTALIDAHFDHKFEIGQPGSKYTKLSSANHKYNCFAHACGYDVWILEQALPDPLGDAYGATTIRDQDYLSRGSVFADQVVANDVLFLNLQGANAHAQLVKAVTTSVGYVYNSYYVTKTTEKDGESGVYQWNDPSSGFATYNAYKKKP